ncbi:hypothetical protein [Ureibacillus manganicus]|uniref:hypothetical protein n=1 Tax=Ureibacillus manganicus TaxID=1266064 RepID=UPI00068E6C88|nr:hypothetical protein [Ureibacillus manganicus]
MSNGKMEEMLTQLIKMVGKIQSEQQEMKVEILGIKAEQQGMRTEFQWMKTELQEIKAEQQGMKTKLQEIKLEQQSMKEQISEIKASQAQFEQKSEDRHQEILRTLHSFKADQDIFFRKWSVMKGKLKS